MEVLILVGNYNNFVVNDKVFYMMFSEIGVNVKFYFKVVKIINEDIKVKDVVLVVNGFEIIWDGKKLLIRKGWFYYMVSVGIGSVNLINSKINFSGWKFVINLRDDWK